MRFLGDKEVKALPLRFLSKLIKSLPEIVRSSFLLDRLLPDVIYVRVEESGDVVISEAPAPSNHSGHVKIIQDKFFTELNRFLLFGYGEKLRELVGGSVFEGIEKCVNHEFILDRFLKANVQTMATPPAGANLEFRVEVERG